MIEVKYVPPHRRVVKEEPRKKEGLKKKEEPKKKEEKKIKEVFRVFSNNLVLNFTMQRH
jgi:hypothetical protein